MQEVKNLTFFHQILSVYRKPDALLKPGYECFSARNIVLLADIPGYYMGKCDHFGKESMTSE